MNMDHRQAREVIDQSRGLELDQEALTVAHLAVEDVLIDFRDSRIGVLGRANGFVINEPDGTPSPIMRLSTRDGLEIAIKAYLQALQETK